MFRHTTSHLTHEPESMVGYGNWILRTMNKMGSGEAEGAATDHGVYCVRNMQGVIVAADSLTRYARRFKDDPGPLNNLGVLLERENLLKTSMDVFSTALDLVREEQKPIVLQNMGRVAVKAGDFKRAVALLERVLEPDFHSLLGLGLSHEKEGNYEQAYDCYRRSLEDAQATDNQKSQILTAMGMIAHKVHGPAAAKTLLLKSSQLQPPAVNALYALFVLGVRHSDNALVNAAVQEMDRYRKTDPNSDLDVHVADIASLKSLVHIAKGDVVGAKRVLVSAAHTHPHLSMVWFKLALHLLEHHTKDEGKRGAATRCLQGAVNLSRCRGGGGAPSSEGPEVSSIDLDGGEHATTLACVLALSYIVNDQSEMAVKSASSAVHNYPHSPMAWSVLAAALDMKKKSHKGLAIQCAKLTAAMSKNTSAKMQQWIYNQFSAK